MRRVAVVLFALTAVPTGWLALRTYGSFELLRSAYVAGAPKTSGIRAWMTLNYVADAYRIPVAALTDRLGLPPGTEPNVSLVSAAQRAGVSPYQYIQQVQRAVAELGSSASPDRVNETHGWLSALGDQVLAAVLVYGYPVLGATLLLGAIGLPLPDGLATTVAGSLAAQGRMNWMAAGIIVVMASLLGDGVGYGLGRLLGREVIARHGRWFGYTPVRFARVQWLFDRWGATTVFITRTFISYLSSVASLLAGIARYRLSKFLAIAAVGRVIWTAAYLGLGYVIGSDLEAAAGFLTNLSGLAVMLTLLAALGLIALERPAQVLSSRSAE
jgi:membrane-associated protein